MFKITDNTDTKMYFETAQECAQYIIDNADAWDEYDGMLRDCYGDVEIGGLSYDVADALEKLDPIAYRCGYSDWMDSNYSDIEYELERLKEHEGLLWFGYSIKREEDEDDR